MIAPTSIPLSGERFAVVYRLAGDEPTAWEQAQALRVEQTIEFPADLIAPDDDIRRQIMGQIAAFQPMATAVYEATITYAAESSGFELLQLLNVIFGNSSIKPGVRVERLVLGKELTQAFRGPRFGRAGLRHYLQVPQRPLLATALKPMGLSPAALAEQAYQFALGGIDIIKDDHGLTNQPFSPFAERVRRCAAAVERANRQNGRYAVYMPNVTGPSHTLLERALLAKELGAGALLISPGLAGLDTMRTLADTDALSLPIISHPAFQGSYVVNPQQGISHYALFGQMNRLAGADAVVFPNFGGRFSFSQDECRTIAEGSQVAMGSIKAAFPAPGGGMSVGRIGEMTAVYGHDVIFLIGGDLHRHPGSLAASARQFRDAVEASLA